MTKKVLVFLHPHFLKPGGASRVVLEQASRLQKKGFYCPIITTRTNPEIISHYSSLNFNCLSSLNTSQLIFWLLFPIFFIKLVIKLKVLKPHFIYCHSLGLYWGFLYKIIFPETKLIVYFHDLGFPYFDSKVEASSLGSTYAKFIQVIKPIFVIIHRQIIKKTNFIIANSHSSSQFLLKKYHRQPDIIVTPGVDLRLFHPSKIKYPYLITVGRLEKIKNIETIIQAFSFFHNQHQKTKLSLKIAGNGNEKKQLKKIVSKLKLDNYVQFLGNQPSEKLAKLYSHAKLVIFMSPHESFGLTAIECLASGTPIIGVNQNGIKEITSNLGNQFLVKNSPTQLAKKIDEIINQDKTLSLANQSRKSVLNYSWNIQTKLLANWLATLP